MINSTYRTNDLFKRKLHFCKTDTSATDIRMLNIRMIRKTEMTSSY